MSDAKLLEQYRQDISRCVKCGACRTVCPTFLAERQESFSPRGRMALVKAVLDNRLPASKIYRDRLATCTTCLACEAACPNNVPVTAIIRAAKEQAVSVSGPDIIRTALSGVFAHPALFRATAWLAPVLLHYKKGQETRLRIAPTLAKASGQAECGLRNEKEKQQGSKGRVVFFPGCAVEHFQQDIGKATVSVLERLGYEAIVPEGLRCCGRPLLSLGDRTGAQELAAHNSAELLKYKAIAIVTACASCGLTFKREYPKLLRPGVKSPPVLDIHEFLSPALIGAVFRPVHKTITWHDPCHLNRGQGLSAVARSILGSLPGLTLVEMRNADRCCGFGGVMRLTHSALSNSIAGDKVRNIMLTGASIVATGCPGCRMQIADALRRAGSDAVAVHTVQVLEEALGIAECGSRNAECETAGSGVK